MSIATFFTLHFRSCQVSGLVDNPVLNNAKIIYYAYANVCRKQWDDDSESDGEGDDHDIVKLTLFGSGKSSRILNTQRSCNNV
jgi:hypothetical protein